MDKFTIMIIIVNTILILGGVGFFFVGGKNASLERDKLQLERDKFEFEKYKFDEMETNKYTYLLHKLKHDAKNDLILKTMETNNLNAMNIRDNETHQKEIDSLLKERGAALLVEKEKAEGMVSTSLKKAQLEAGLNFKEDILDTFDNVIRISVETHLYKHVLQYNDIDTINQEDIKIPVGTAYIEQLESIKKKIMDNFGFEAITIFDRYMKREMWENMLFDMLSVYWSKSINIAKTRKLQLAKSENMTLAKDSQKKPIFINNTANPNAGLTNEQYTLIRDLKLKDINSLNKVIEQIRNDKDNIFGTAYKPLLDIQLANYR